MGQEHLLGMEKMQIVITSYSIHYTKLYDENLSFRLIQEEEPWSEMLLKEMEFALFEDSVVKDEVSKDDIDIEKLTKYLKANYFTGYLERYDVQLIP